MSKEAALSFAVGEKFYSFEELEDKIMRLKQTTGVELWRSDETTIKAAPKRLAHSLPEAIKYYQVRYSCLHSSRKLNRKTADDFTKAVYVVVISAL